MVNKTYRCLLKNHLVLVAVSLTLGACASGGGGTVNTISSVASVPPTNPNPAPTQPATETDNRIKFEPVTFKETLTKYGDIETTYSISVSVSLLDWRFVTEGVEDSLDFGSVAESGEIKIDFGTLAA